MPATTLFFAILLAAAPQGSTAPDADDSGSAAGPCAEIEQLDAKEPLAAGEVRVHMRSLPDDRLKEGVALFLIDAPADLVFELVTDHEAFPGTVPYVTESRLRRDESGDVIVYQHLDLPFPIANRHYEIRVERERDLGRDGRCAESRWSYLEDSGNIDDTFGRWEVLALDDDSTLVAYVVWVDPGGLVPDWAQNWASKRALPRLAEAIRDAARERAGRR